MNNKPKYDLTGKQFGKFTVIEYVGNGGKWRCRCECGVVYYVRTSRLKKGTFQSCNCKTDTDTSEILKPYVFESLSRYGNTVISNQTFEQYGEKILLEELRQHGFDCRMYTTFYSDTKNIIIELKR